MTFFFCCRLVNFTVKSNSDLFQVVSSYFFYFSCTYNWSNRWNLGCFVEYIRSVEYLCASCVCLVVDTSIDVTSFNSCCYITFSPVRCSVVSISWNFKFQCANENCCQFLYSYVCFRSKQFLNGILTFQDTSFRCSSYVFSSPVGSFNVAVTSFARNRLKVDRFNDYFSKFCASNKFVKTCSTVWVTSNDTSFFQCVELSLW
ncbi:hypothetical protein D3C81_1088100 [compost metagenome]